MYDINFFIAKYELVPANLFCPEIHGKDGAHCYIGHCDNRASREEAFALADILWDNLHVSAAELVFGQVPQFQQPCLKERILAALFYIQAKGAVEEVQSIINDRPETHEQRMER